MTGSFACVLRSDIGMPQIDGILWMAKNTLKWAKRPSATEFDGALRYLSLQFSNATAKKLVTKARQGTPTEHVAKDILRASELPLLPDEERHVADNLKKIRKGKGMAPIILIQGDLIQGRPLVVADGYHRLCAACHADEDAPVAAVIVSP
jgi:hypothetical protein